METAVRCLDNLSRAVDHSADGSLIAMLFNEVRVAIRDQDEKIERLTHELEAAQKH